VAFALMLPLATLLQPLLDPSGAEPHAPGPGSGWPVLGLSSIYVGLFGGLFGSLRLRRAGGQRRQQLPHELAATAALVPAVWAGALLAHVVGAAWLLASGSFGLSEALPAAAGSPLIAAVACGVGYALGRGVVLIWPLWDRLRRRRLLWALTHAQLVAALTLAVIVAALLTTADYLAGVRGPPFGPETIPDDAGPAAPLLAWVTTRLLPAATALLALSVAASLAVLPLAALISYLALRRTTRRLEALATGAEALRAGDLTARVLVGGQDEVGRLQATFNAMAVDLERTLRDLEAERDRVAGLLEARRQLVANVSHELRTPVATIRGYLESAHRRSEALPADPSASSGAALSEAKGQAPSASSDAALSLTGAKGKGHALNEAKGNGQALRADLETMEREVARLQRLIEDLFTLSRAEVGRLELRLEPTDAGAVVRRLVDTTARLAWGQRRVEVLAEVAPDLPPACADAQRLEQIVGNLLGNAVRHTPPGGLVAAAVSAEPDAVRVEVRDTGEGIAPEELPRVFERFYRGQGGDGRAGAGLGLALVKELAEAMGGSAEAASTPREGSRFTVRLPRV